MRDETMHLAAPSRSRPRKQALSLSEPRASASGCFDPSLTVAARFCSRSFFGRFGRFLSVAVPCVMLMPVLAGCGNTTRKPPIEVFSDMRRQPKYQPLAASPFFADGRASRAPVPGTVALGHLKADDAFETGIDGKMYVGRNPLPLDAALLSRGQERYDIYCAPCHDRAGDGKGIVALRSSWLAINLHDQRIHQMTDGELFNVASYGRRTMPAYRFQVSADDRWAIVAYVRALQRARLGTVEDVPPELRGRVR